MSLSHPGGHPHWAGLRSESGKGGSDHERRSRRREAWLDRGGPLGPDLFDAHSPTNACVGTRSGVKLTAGPGKDGTTILVASPADRYAGEISSHYPSEQPARRKSLGRPRTVDRHTGLLGSCKMSNFQIEHFLPGEPVLPSRCAAQGRSRARATGGPHPGRRLYSSVDGEGAQAKGWGRGRHRDHSDVGYERVAAVYRWP